MTVGENFLPALKVAELDKNVTVFCLTCLNAEKTLMILLLLSLMFPDWLHVDL